MIYIIFFEIVCWIQLWKAPNIAKKKTNQKFVKKFLMSFLALTHSILIFFKRAILIWIHHKIAKKMMFIKKILFLGPYGDFFDIKPLICNRYWLF